MSHFCWNLRKYRGNTIQGECANCLSNILQKVPLKKKAIKEKNCEVQNSLERQDLSLVPSSLER